MITCLQAGHLPAINCSPDATQPAGSRTLTEVVCTAIFGAPLKPGRDQGSLDAACAPLRLESRALWRNENGPAWLCPHLELIVNGETWPFDPDTQDDSERHTLNGFAAAQRWLTKSRKLGFAHGLPGELAEKLIRLASMTDSAAIAHALAEAVRIERAECAINANATDFYKLLSDAIATQRIALMAIATDPQTQAWLPRTRGEPPHQTIPHDYFQLPLCHNLFDNYLEANRFSTEAKMLDRIFNRIERMKDAMLVKWSDVKVPSEHASWLLSTTRNKGKGQGDRPLSTIPEPHQAITWNPNWLSLPGAIMWVATRDQTLTRKADEALNNDRGIKLGVHVRLASEKVLTGEQRTLHIEIEAAWPALRRLIADERIVAEGRSLERRGISTAVETRYPNQRIPSGDAANLIILGNVPGIEHKDALAPDEMYRFTNWQGRYWYDVRLRAADVFREFPLEYDMPQQPELSRPAEPAPAPPKKSKPSFEKITAAIEAEEKKTGKPFPVLRPVERDKRLTDRMKAQGLKEREIPNERTFREYFNQGPGKPAKSG